MIENEQAEPIEANQSGRKPGARRLTMRVPGSTANLGPGFDTLALALNIHCTLVFDLLENDDKSVPLISLLGAEVQTLPKDQTNPIYTILRDNWKGKRETLDRIRISIRSDIPMGRGLGSSAAATMGAVLAASALGNENSDHGTLIARAASIEGHADNVSASLLGGLTICSPSEHSANIITQKLTWPSQWCPIVVVPGYVLSTKKARAALPESVKHGDAVRNVQKVSLLLSAVVNQEEEALKEALHDRLHEPYRLPLVPELGQIRKLLADSPILGCVLSGAGSSVLTLVNQRHKMQVVECLRSWAANQKEPPNVLDLQVDQEGIRVSHE